MNGSEVLKMQQQLDEIITAANTLKRSTQWIRRPDMVVLQSNLSHVWNVTLELQRRVAHPAMVHGLCCDALDQVARVYDLITECDGVPDGQQLKSIGFAMEVAAERIKFYQQMSQHAAQVRASHGEGVLKAVAITATNTEG